MSNGQNDKWPMGKWHMVKMANCQNGTLPKWHIAKMAHCQNGTLAKWQIAKRYIAKMAHGQNVHMAKMAYCQSGILPKWLITKVASWQNTISANFYLIELFWETVFVWPTLLRWPQRRRSETIDIRPFELLLDQAFRTSPICPTFWWFRGSGCRTNRRSSSPARRLISRRLLPSGCRRSCPFRRRQGSFPDRRTAASKISVDFGKNLETQNSIGRWSSTGRRRPCRKCRTFAQNVRTSGRERWQEIRHFFDFENVSPKFRSG